MYFRKYEESIIHRTANNDATIADIFDGNDEFKIRIPCAPSEDKIGLRGRKVKW
jgi:hypothetical protein